MADQIEKPGNPTVQKYIKVDEDIPNSMISNMPGHASDVLCACVPDLQETSDSLELFTEGDELYQTMLASISSAHTRIQLETYIFSDDETGQRFVDVLIERAQAGVDVCVHIDAAGSLFLLSRRMEQDLRENNVQLRWFHRWSWRQPLRYNRRNHRKLLVVDEETAYTGGFNIHKQSSRSAFGEHRWRDTHVRCCGYLAGQAAQLFDRFWQGDYNWLPPVLPTAHSELMPNYSRACRQRLRCVFTDMFSRAEHSIFLTTPYFVPDRRTQRLLASAASRGVDVRLLVPHKSDVPLAQWAAQAAYEELLKNGVRIFEYLPRLLHAKTTVVDGNYATVGTANMDYRSFFVNYELNLFTRDPVLCHQLQEQFYTDLETTEEINSRQWSQRFWGKRLRELIGWLARRWL